MSNPNPGNPIFMNPRSFSGFNPPPFSINIQPGNPGFGPGFKSPFSASLDNDPGPMVSQITMQVQQHTSAIHSLHQQLVNIVLSQVAKNSYLNQRIVDLSSELAKVHNENISLKILNKTTTKKRNKATSKPFVHGAVPGLTVEETNNIINIFKNYYYVDINGSKLYDVCLTEFTVSPHCVQYVTNDLLRMKYIPVSSSINFNLGTMDRFMYVYSNYAFVYVRDIVFSLKIVPREATAEDPDKVKLYLEHIAD